MNKKKILATVIIITLVFLSFFSGNTFAKYLTEYNTSASLDVAKWSVTEDFLVNGQSSISKNINLATNYEPDTLVNGKIAPGTSGSFGVKVDATGTETGIIYEIGFSNISGTKPKNLVFIYKDQYYSTLSELSSAINNNTIINADAADKILNLEVMWSWSYQELDSENPKEIDIQDTLDRSKFS